MKRLLLCLLLVGCAQKDRSPPLPGDSVSADGSVSLKSPALVTNATTNAAPAPLSPLEARLFPAELVMEHEAALKLTPAQKDTITKDLDKTQGQLVKLQWDLQAEKDKLVKLLDDAKVDEAKSKTAADALMVKENAIKSTHLALLVRIKNVLTPEQQATLVKVRETERCGAGARDGGTP